MRRVFSGAMKARAGVGVALVCGTTLVLVPVAAAGVRAGIGATRAQFVAVHPEHRAGCQAGTCFGSPLGSPLGPTNEFTMLGLQNGRVSQYVQAFPNGTSITTAESQVLHWLPSDTVLRGTGIIHGDSTGQSCRWLNVQSRTLKPLFPPGKGKQLKLPGLETSDKLSIEFDTETATGDSVYDHSNINEAYVGPPGIWMSAKSGC